MFLHQISAARNDRIVQPFVLCKTGFNWSGCTWTVRLLNKVGGTVLATPTPTIDASVVGTASCSVTLVGEDRTAWPAAPVLEFTVEKAAASFGPHTFARVTIRLS